MSSLRDHLQAIYDEHQRLTPALVLETARKEGHPLHAMVFTLAPDHAAEAWYLQRAQELITRVKIVYKKTSSGPREVRAWHAVRGVDDEYVYEPADVIARNPVAAQILLRDMERDWKQMRDRYGHMKEFIVLVQGTLEEAA